jgi:hypothetical protein
LSNAVVDSSPPDYDSFGIELTEVIHMPDNLNPIEAQLLKHAFEYVLNNYHLEPHELNEVSIIQSKCFGKGVGTLSQDEVEKMIIMLDKYIKDAKEVDVPEVVLNAFVDLKTKFIGLKDETRRIN